MRAVVQLVKRASVSVAGERTGAIGRGLLVLLGVGDEDDNRDADLLVDKIVNLRIFPDEQEKMNLSLLDVKGELLAVSQFTLFGDCRKGRRPSYSHAAPPQRAQELYQFFVEQAARQVPTATGVFQAMMEVELINDGPVTLLIDSRKCF